MDIAGTEQVPLGPLSPTAKTLVPQEKAKARFDWIEALTREHRGLLVVCRQGSGMTTAGAQLGEHTMPHRSTIIKTGHGPGTAIAVLMVGLMAVGFVFLVLGSSLYFSEQPSDQRAQSSPPARSIQAVDGRAAN
ncbi:hypothetical protein [Mesorhizobium sp. Root695]|jgi:hypothetical protein|uniref:hypothetical protein n=1 Tax=Mesorhizobium sp. Root695 TaxID=1736589 RepID=UPI000B12BC1A|nr:hypothetical protein [Mesorhizobium sp. Root695]